MYFEDLFLMIMVVKNKLKIIEVLGSRPCSADVGEDMQPASVAQEEEEEVEDVPIQELETSFAFFMTEGGDED